MPIALPRALTGDKNRRGFRRVEQQVQPALLLLHVRLVLSLLRKEQPEQPYQIRRSPRIARVISAIGSPSAAFVW